MTSAKEKTLISLKELSKELFSFKSVALVCHIRPDGDTLGSSLALSKALESKGIEVAVFCDDIIPDKFNFLPAVSQVKRTFEGDYQAFVAIDCADKTRLGELEGAFLSHKNTFVIDHHISNGRYAKTNYVEDLSSNCELVYNLINLANVKIDQDIANLLAMGIMTDTGNFKHKNVNANTFLVMSKLVEFGADVNRLNYEMFSKQSRARASLFASTMSKIRYELDGKLAFITVFNSELERTGAKQAETEGFIDFIMGIHGVEVGMCMLEVATNKFKISLRSRGTDVNAVAGEFDGGGHVLASGCQIHGEYEEVVDRLTVAVKRHIVE